MKKLILGWLIFLVAGYSYADIATHQMDIKNNSSHMIYVRGEGGTWEYKGNLADGKYTFFEKLLRQLNRKEKQSIYFLQIQDVKNMFPMLSISTDLKGKENGRLEVTKITNKIMDPSMFEVPKGYNKFEK